MTVSTTTARVDYAGNGVTVLFSVPFPFIQNNYLQVLRINASTLVSTTLVLDSVGANGYTVTGAGNDSGFVTVVTAPTASERLAIVRVVPATQEADFVANDPFPAETFEDALDKLTMVVGQAVSDVGRALKLFEGDLDGSGRYDANGNRIVALADGVAASDAATVGQLIGAGSGNFIASGAGSVTRTMQNKVRESVSVLDFGATGDGATDDTAAFEAALAAADRVFVPATANSYRVDNVQIPSGTTLYGEGIASKLTPFTIGAAYILEPDAGCSDVTIRDLWLDAPKATYPAKILIVAGTPTRMVISDCTVTGGASPIFLVSSTDCVVQRCVVSGFVNSGVTLETAAVRSKVLDCAITGTGSTLNCIQFTGGAGCIISGNGAFGAGVFGIFGDSSTSCIVDNNTTRETIREGINLNRCVNCAISNNGVSFLSAASVGTDFGISLWGSGGVSRNNVISGNTVLNSYLSGIALAGDEDVQAYNVVIGNTIENCGRSNLADTAGVVVYGTDSLNNLVVDNMIFDNVGVLRYGVFDDPAAGNPVGTKIRGNLVQGASVADVSRMATSIEAINGRSLRTWTPTVVSTTGTITTLGTVVAKYYEVEKMVYVEATIPITTNGTGGGAVSMTLPFAASANPAILSGRENSVTGFTVTGFISASASVALLRMYDNAYPGGNGREIIVSGWYERA